MSVFSIFTSKRRRAVKSGPTVNEYYAGIAKRLSFAKLALLFLLVCFIAFGYTFYGGELTMENFRYMMKFMSVDMDSAVNSGSRIRYDSDDKTVYTILNGDVAVVGRNGIYVYDTNGQRLLKQTADFNEPMCAVNGKHLIVADRSSTQLNIYSAYSLLYTQNFSYPITSVTASPAGCYALITSALGYKTGVEIYDSDFRIIFKYYYADRYADRIALSDDGKTAAVAAIANTSDGDFAAYFYLFRILESEEPLKVFTFTDEVPWSVNFFSDGTFALLTDSALRFCDADGNVTRTVAFGDRNIKRFCASDGNYVLCFGTAGLSNATTVEIYKSDGSLLMSRNLKNDVSSVDIIGDYAYIYSVGALYTVDLMSRGEDKTDSIGLDYIGVLEEPDSSSMIMLYKNTALVYNIDDFSKTALTPPES